MSQFHSHILLIAPQWPRPHWYTNLLQLLIAVPKRLPVIPEMLVQPKTKIFHPDPGIFKLTAWLLSTEISKQQAFQNALENYTQPLGGKEHKRTISVSLQGSIAGVLKGKKIPIQFL